MAVIRASRIHTSLGTLTRRTPHPANPCPRTPFSLDRFGCVKALNILLWEHWHHSLTRCLPRCPSAGVAAVVPTNGTQSDKLGIASPQPIFSLDPYHEHPDGRCMPHVTGSICHIAYTATLLVPFTAICRIDRALRLLAKLCDLSCRSCQENPQQRSLLSRPFVPELLPDVWRNTRLRKTRKLVLHDHRHYIPMLAPIPPATPFQQKRPPWTALAAMPRFELPAAACQPPTGLPVVAP